jgi:cytochrome c
MDNRPVAEKTWLPTSLRLHLVLVALLPILPFTACGGDGGGDGTGDARAGAGGDGITAEQMEKGIGSITSVDLGPIDPALVARGDQVYQLKCSACHKLDDRYVGPPLRDVTDRRTPEFIMNMLLNSWEMTQRHPTVRELLAEYYTPMPDQDLSEEDARAILDYLRNAAREGGGG